MLVKLTEKCSMGCSHCFSNCTSTGKDMSMGVFLDVLDFYERTSQNGAFMISGGEPSENPMFFNMASIAIERFSNSNHAIIITTNGWWIEKNPDSCRKLLNYAVMKNCKLIIQVTNDRRYYPIRINIPADLRKRKEIFINGCSGLVAQGRALDNYTIGDFTNKCPGCFNALLIARQLYFKGGNLKCYLASLTGNGKFCSPQISVTGDIKAGESDLCPPISSIYESDSKIFEKISLFSCNKCKQGYNFLKKYNYEAYNLFLILGRIRKCDY